MACSVVSTCPITGASAQAPSTPTIISNILELKTVEGDTQTSLSCGIEAEGNEQIKLSDLLNSKIVQTKSGAFTATVMTPAGPMIMVRESSREKVRVQLVNRNNAVVANECDYGSWTLSNCKIGSMFPVTTQWTTRPVWGQIRDVADSLKADCAALIVEMNNRWIAGRLPCRDSHPFRKINNRFLRVEKHL